MNVDIDARHIKIWAETLAAEVSKYTGITPMMIGVRPEYAAPIVQVSLPVAAAIGAAAVVIKNPAVTRRFWSPA